MQEFVLGGTEENKVSVDTQSVMQPEHNILAADFPTRNNQVQGYAMLVNALLFH